MLGTAIASAPEVLRALDSVDWSLLESVRGFAGRRDGLGDKAERLLADVARAATDEEFARPLAPVLSSIRRQAVELINEAARLALLVESGPRNDAYTN